MTSTTGEERLKEVKMQGEYQKSKSYKLKLSPCAEQTPEEIETYYRSARESDVAVVRNTQYRTLRYSVTRIQFKRPEIGRLNIENEGDFYIKSGKNCYHPTGQKRLVVPTANVLKWAQEHPLGELGYLTSPPPELFYRNGE